MAVNTVPENNLYKMLMWQETFWNQLL